MSTSVAVCVRVLALQAAFAERSTRRDFAEDGAVSEKRSCLSYGLVFADMHLGCSGAARAGCCQCATLNCTSLATRGRSGPLLTNVYRATERHCVQQECAIFRVSNIFGRSVLLPQRMGLLRFAFQLMNAVGTGTATASLLEDVFCNSVGRPNSCWHADGQLHSRPRWSRVQPGSARNPLGSL